jgi:hypothetical protein
VIQINRGCIVFSFSEKLSFAVVMTACAWAVAHGLPGTVRLFMQGW